MEKQLIPQLRFPNFIKENYSSVKFGSVIKNSGYGPRFNGNDYDVSGNVKTIRGTDISLNGEIIYDQVPIAKLDESFIKNHILADGDLVMITTADCGLTGVFRGQNIKYIPSAYAVKIGLKDTASPIYFKYFFQTSIAKNQINRFVRKATVANLPCSDIPKLNINIPCISEQQKIALFLTDVDDKITKLTKKKDLLEQYKKGIMQKIFNQELRFKDDNGNAFPKWDVKKLGEVATKKSSNISANTIEENSGEFKIYGASGLLKKIDFYREEEPYISIVKDGAGVGRTLLCDAFSSVLGTLDIIKPKKGVNLYFIYCLLNNINFLKFITGSTIPHIYFKDYSTVKIEVPCLDEQTKIANFLSDIDIKIEVLNTKIEHSKAFKKGLLQQMFV